MLFDFVIFDFNGTLYWDTHLHNKAWDLFLADHNLIIHDEEKNHIIHGRHNRDILKTLFGEEITNENIRSYIKEKEGIYQDLVKKTALKLAPGVEDFLDYLKRNEIKFTIATASGIENITFYFDHLDLARWFDFSKVVFDNGLIKSKPDPEIFLTAMHILGAYPSRTVIFEDSVTGIKAALAAKPGKVIHVKSPLADYSPGDLDTISHFDQASGLIFKKK